MSQLSTSLNASPGAGPHPESSLPSRTPPPRWMWVGGAVAALALILGVALLLGRSPPPQAPQAPAMTVNGDSVLLHPDAPQWRYVELAVAQENTALVPLPAPGRVDFDEKRSASVGSPLPGRIERVLVRVGDKVKPGDRLFSVRSGALADLERDVATAQEAVAVKKRLAERARELVALKASPEKDLLASEAELREAELALKASRAKRDSLQVNPEGENLFWVVAPRAGTVVDLDLFASQEVTPDRDKPLLRLSELAEVLVLADVQENDAYDVRVGAPVVIKTQSGSLTRPGVVDHVSAVVDPKRRTVEVRIRAKNDDGLLRPNAYVEVSLASDPAVKRVRVPAEAVVTEGNRSMVFVSREAGKLERVAVTLGRQRDGEVELREGLPPGAHFVSRGAILLLNQIELAD